VTQFHGCLLSPLFCSRAAHFTEHSLATYIDSEDLACGYLSLARSEVEVLKTSILIMDSGTTVDAWLRRDTDTRPEAVLEVQYLPLRECECVLRLPSGTILFSILLHPVARLPPSRSHTIPCVLEATTT
jgi:hypothetical protein